MILIRGSSYAQNLNSIESQIRRTARYIFGMKSNEPISDIIQHELKWLFPNQNYYYKAFCFLHSLKNNEIPFRASGSFHTYATRDACNLRGNFCTKNRISERSIQFHPVSAWNRLPVDLRDCKDNKMFKIKLKEYILSNKDKF